ncbi:hypothetical protein Tco_0463088 [Tanacetum coccineum]
MVQNAKADFMDLDSSEGDPVIMIDESKEDDKEDKAENFHATSNVETKDTSLEQLKNKDDAKVAFLIAQPSFLNVAYLNELLVNSLHTKFLKILSAHDFSSSLPTELKELPSKFHELTEEVKGLKKHVYEREIKLPGDLKEILTKLEEFTKTVTSLTS